MMQHRMSNGSPAKGREVVSGKLRLPLRLSALLLLAMVLGSCGPSAQEVDYRIATAIAAIPTATPQPTPTPQRIPSLEEIDARIARGIEAIPASTPQPTATPQPTPTQQPTPTPQRIPSLEEIDARVARGIAAITPVAPAASVAITSSASGTGEATLGGGLVLRIDPGRPVAGRNIRFALSGLKPWQRFTVRFYDAQGSPAPWIVVQEVALVSASSPAIFDRTLFADGLGQATWTRIGTLDNEGNWGLRVKVDSAEYVASYTLYELQLETTPVRTLGLDFRRYQGLATDSFASALVHESMAVDLQAHLLQVVEKLRDRLALQSVQIPDIYLLGNQSLFETASKGAGVTLSGWEAGFDLAGGAAPGIYMKTDQFATQERQTLAHEYVHLLLDEMLPKAQFPAWVNEGVAVYYELTLGLEVPGAYITRNEVFWRADLVKAAAKQQTLIPLTSLESQRLWNGASKDQVSLQYSEAYMAVRYVVERFGEKSLMKLLEQLAAGRSVDASLITAVGVPYVQFQSGFSDWAQGWQDTQREALRSYMNAVDGIMTDWEAIMADRAKGLGSSSVTSNLSLLNRAKALQTKAAILNSPASAQELQAQLAGFLKVAVDWLQMEYTYSNTGNDSKRVQANGMIPEVDARENNVYRYSYDLETEYRLR